MSRKTAELPFTMIGAILGDSVGDNLLQKYKKNKKLQEQQANAFLDEQNKNPGKKPFTAANDSNASEAKDGEKETTILQDIRESLKEKAKNAPAAAVGALLGDDAEKYLIERREKKKRALAKEKADAAEQEKTVSSPISAQGSVDTQSKVVAHDAANDDMAETNKEALIADQKKFHVIEHMDKTLTSIEKILLKGGSGGADGGLGLGLPGVPGLLPGGRPRRGPGPNKTKGPKPTTEKKPPGRIKKAFDGLKKTGGKVGEGAVRAGGSIKNASKGLLNAGKGFARGAGRFIPGVGTALTVGLSGYEAYEANEAGDQRGVNSAIGSGIGTLVGGALGSIGGPLGMIAGAYAGQWVGEKLGGLSYDFAQHVSGSGEPAVNQPTLSTPKPSPTPSDNGKKIAEKGNGANIHKISDTVADAIDAASTKVGVPRSIMYAMARQESGFNPNAKAKTSSAAGLFQFIKGTWGDMVKQYGSKFPILAEKGPMDPEASAIAGALFIKQNAKVLERAGIPVNGTSIYAAHFLGAGGARSLLSKPPDTIAADILPKAAKANKYIFYDTKDGDRPRTVAEVQQVLFDKVGKYADMYANQIGEGGAVSDLGESVGSEGAIDVSPDIPYRSDAPNAPAVKMQVPDLLNPNTSVTPDIITAASTAQSFLPTPQSNFSLYPDLKAGGSREMQIGKSQVAAAPTTAPTAPVIIAPQTTNNNVSAGGGGSGPAINWVTGASSIDQYSTSYVLRAPG